MKTQIKFRNENGQFCKTNQNNGFEIETEICKIKAKRNGQQSAMYGNKIKVCVNIESNGNRIKFENTLFDHLLYGDHWNNDQTWMATEFLAKTWREAFVEAKKYIDSELKKYSDLKEAREQALVDAEF